MQRYRGIPAGYEDEDSEDDLDRITYSTQNLKITVVPDITTSVGLDGQNFECKLSSEMQEWFDEFKETYRKGKCTPGAQHLLKLVLSKDAQPLTLALKFFAASPGCNYLKNKSMAYFILETVCVLYKENPTIEESCDDNIRMVAFNFIKTSGIVSLCKAVSESYQLLKIQQHIIPKLKTLVTEGFYKDAAYWSIILNVTHIFGLFDLIFPLILQEKISLAEEFLKVATDLQLPTIKFLDTLLDRKKTVYENCGQILQTYRYSDVKHNILNYRPMSKMVTRLAKKYSIDSQYTPNLKYSKSCSYLHYLFHKYQDGGMNFDSWRELAYEESNRSKEVQLNLVKKIAGYGDLEEALYWVHLYKIPVEECPLILHEKLQNFPKTSAERHEICWNNSTTPTLINKQKDYSLSVVNKDEYLSLQLRTESIMVIDTETKFRDMLTYLEKHLLIGFDSEWKPSVSNNDRVSLIQLATIDRVYLVDCLSPHIHEKLWKLMGHQIFNNQEILKIGFCLHYDLQMLHKSLPLRLNLQTTSSYLDLRDLWHQMKHMQIAPFSSEQLSVSGESLSALTEICLGKKLDKSNQCSNWANRPLRHDQMVYAALDAHCLLKLYEVISQTLLRIGINIDSMVANITTSKSGYLFGKKAKTNSESSMTSNNESLQYDVKVMKEEQH